jgi:hypothetical protein
MFLGVVHGLQKFLTDHRIGRGAGFFHQTVVVGEEFALQGAEAVKLSEEVGGAAKCVGQRLVGMGGDIAVQGGVSGWKVEIVQGVQRGIDGRLRRRGEHRAHTQRQEKNQLQAIALQNIALQN